MTTTEGERAWLVRLCAGITRDRDAAEDLAQGVLSAWAALSLVGVARGLPWRVS